MARAKGINSHKLFKLEKAAAKKDTRNLKMATVLKAAPKLPKSYDFDKSHSGIPTPTFANDDKGDCVIAGRAHQTLRFEKIEQGSVLMISDNDVLKEYFQKLADPTPDWSCLILSSCGAVRVGRWASGRIRFRLLPKLIRPTILRYARPYLVMWVSALVFNFPTQRRNRFKVGSHGMLPPGLMRCPALGVAITSTLRGYTPQGPVCVTWGRKQQITWAWLDKYCDESYAIFDAKNRFKKSMINGAKIKAFLKAL